MSYYFDGTQWKQIENQRFALPPSSSGTKWEGHIHPQESGQWPRMGSEAVCLRALGQEFDNTGARSRSFESVIKIFMRDLEGRRDRFNFLVRQRLARQYPWLFRCVPYSAFNTSINGVPVIGHLSRYAIDDLNESAEDFDRLKQNSLYDGYSANERRQFVADLATAVFILEAKSISHGDLSDGNVLITPIVEAGRNGAILCDFDGFHHAAAPKLPRKQRPLGTLGYVPPFMLDRMRADLRRQDDNIYVGSDRFALAVLACELMCWRDEFGALLGDRDRLLDNASATELRDGSWSIPEAITTCWPDGFALLERAARATDWDELPSPLDWLQVVKMPPSVDGLPFTHPPFLKCRRAGQDAIGGWKSFILTQAKGPMQPINSGLDGISYERDGGALSIVLPDSEIAMFGPLERLMKKVVGPIRLKVNPASRLIVGGMEIEIHDKAKDEGVRP